MSDCDIRFYHLHRQSVSQALPALLQKAYHAEKRIVVKCRTAKETEDLNKALWSFSEDSFLPHGSAKDGYASAQPIWLTSDNDDNPNQADMFLTTSPPEENLPDGYDIYCVMFNGADEEELQAARVAWRRFKDEKSGVLSYFQQGEKGGWSKKA